jgi:hypothetical protein
MTKAHDSLRRGQPLKRTRLITETKGFGQDQKHGQERKPAAVLDSLGAGWWNSGILEWWKDGRMEFYAARALFITSRKTCTFEPVLSCCMAPRQVGEIRVYEYV